MTNPESFNRKFEIEQPICEEPILTPIDGTEALCQALYNRKATPRDYLGGSDALMIWDAARLINKFREFIHSLEDKEDGL